MAEKKSRQRPPMASYLTVRFPAETHEKIRGEADRLGVTYGCLVRIWVGEALEKLERKVKRSA